MMSLQARKRKSTAVCALKRASGWWKEADVLPEYALEQRPEFTSRVRRDGPVTAGSLRLREAVSARIRRT